MGSVTEQARDSHDTVTAHLKKRLGQHILESPEMLGAIVDAAGVSEGDAVLEIGPGPGTLTRVLAQRVGPGGRVLAIELDRDWQGALDGVQRAFPQVDVRWEDALATDLDGLLAERQWRCVANIPYYITSPLVQKLVEARQHFRIIALLMQKEVAERLNARRGRDVGSLSHYVQQHAESAIALEVPPSAFRPPPRVDSALLLLRPLSQPRVEVPYERLRPIIAAAFAARRKMLRGTLRALADDGAAVEAWLARAGISPTARAEDLLLEDWARLARTRPGTAS